MLRSLSASISSEYSRAMSPSSKRSEPFFRLHQVHAPRTSVGGGGKEHGTKTRPLLPNTELPKRPVSRSFGEVHCHPRLPSTLPNSSKTSEKRGHTATVHSSCESWSVHDRSTPRGGTRSRHKAPSASLAICLITKLSR